MSSKIFGMHLASVVVVIKFYRFTLLSLSCKCHAVGFVFGLCCFLPWNFQFEQLRIADLKVAAQKSLGQSFLRLIAPDGHVLDPQQSLKDEGLQEGDACFRFAFEYVSGIPFYVLV